MRTHVRLEFVLRQGDFAVELHERLDVLVVALFGPSGSGKTTVLEAVAGLRRPTAGVIEVGGSELFSSARRVNLPARARGIGYVPQDSVLFPHMNVRRNILYGAGRGATVPLDRVLEILEIDSLIDREVASLSGGERQRVALARALVSSPKLLLLDEPLAALDLSLRRRIVPCLRRIRDELGVPMAYVSHDGAEVRAIADHVVVLDRGRATASGPPDEALRDALL
jgi:molybdate transport system ATP-binding protein